MDPLRYYLSHTGFDQSNISRLVTGEKYVGIMLNNGHIGVCSTLGTPVAIAELDFDQPNLDKRAHRIAYNAYINAMLNYQTVPEDHKDIFQHVDFSARKEIVMVGFFRPLVTKFTQARILLHIFDQNEQDPILTPMELLGDYLLKASTIILTSTSIFNNTFTPVIEQTGEQASIFLLGPSSILHGDMKKYRNVKKVYGARFQPYDHRDRKSVV